MNRSEKLNFLLSQKEIEYVKLELKFNYWSSTMLQPPRKMNLRDNKLISLSNVGKSMCDCVVCDSKT